MNVIFDIGNVLVGYDWPGYLRTFGYTDEIYERIADAVFRNDDWLEGDIGRISTEEWLGLFIENAPDLKEQICEVFAGFEGTIVPLSYTEDWLSYFRRQGYRLYYLSNYSCELYQKTKDKLAFLEAFDGGIFSYEVKCIKPQEEIYRLLLERFNINPGETVFYDDRPENVDAAIRLGIKGVVFHKDIPLQMLGK